MSRLGKMSKLIEKSNDTTTTTKIMQISLHSWELLQNHSRKYHDQPISYDEIIKELCSFYNEKHEQKYFLS
jgi:hypothetical protein